MNNLQHIVKDNTRFAWHVAVELCEQGDFDNVTDAVRWLMQERNDAASGCKECEITPIAKGSDMGRCSACGKIADTTSNYCWKCGAKVVNK